MFYCCSERSSNVRSLVSFYYLDIRYNLLHYSAYIVVVTVLSATSSLLLCTKDVVDFTAVKCTSMVFRITAMKVRQLPRHISAPDLQKVIASHQAVLRCAKTLQQALSLSLLFQLAFCSAIWVLMLFYILLMVRNGYGFDSRILNLVLLLMIVTSETYVYCILGTNLTEQSDEVVNALQELAWYEQPVSIQKQLLLMIRRSQEPTVLTAGKLIPVNIAQFSAMVQKSYSFYLVLKDLF
ncbi:odorant receptor 7a-like [Anopheles bellator]|uniref:odorant receptor 7a-like n=1 Tax=Anopheles bellator TaxID=139047 RepID=UPI00264A0964|nr:odorant receptor 7a-like [Anopheles bellator]